jgi:hypothetical protein
MPAKRKSDKAVRLAILSLRGERQMLAFDANLYDLGVADYPQARSASKRRKEIDAAIAELTESLEVAKVEPAARRRSRPKQMEMFS